jgi:hypothetical protein
MYKPMRNRIFHEETLSHPNIPGLGQLTGPADYLISQTKRDLVDDDDDESPDMSMPINQAFLIIEAKKNSTVSEKASFAQLLAQLLALELGDNV